MGSIADFIGILRQDVADRDARIATLEAALAKAEEALVCATGLIPPIGHTEDALHQVGVLVNEALAAIKETRHG